MRRTSPRDSGGSEAFALETTGALAEAVPSAGDAARIGVDWVDH